MLREVVIALTLAALTQHAHAEAVAKVGSVEISLQEFKEKYAETKRQTINPPSPEVFLNDLVRFYIGVQEADKKKMRNDPVVQDGFNQVLYKTFIEREIGKKIDSIKVTDAELRSHYDKNPEIRSSHILIEFKSDATPEQVEIAHKRAEEILADVKKSKRPFEELVRLYSDDALSKNAGGDIGFQNRVTVVPTYYETLLKMKPNEIAGPIRTQYGWHIIKMTGRHNFQDANVRQLRAVVFDEKRKELFDQLFKQLANQYPVTRNEKLVKSLK
jgi:peptidyl-prolyl cis-trans isomerase C/peptidyl-prolyl cis-trans isomerase D